MFKKRLFAVAVCVCMLFISGCKENPVDVSSADNSSIISEVSSTETEEKIEEPSFSVNPLTGVKSLDPNFENTRPVAVMINNISVAQGVQTGLNSADIIYETEVEQGVTRLMAVFQDITKVEKIGSVRSARYAYIDLAMGHNAIYCHHGQDPTYAKPHLKDTFTYTIDSNNAGKRISNGLATEHTLYGFGEKLWGYLENAGKTENKNGNTPWLNFVSEEENLTLSGGTANNVTVKFSGLQTTSFEYDLNRGEYIRKSNGTTLKDYYTGDVTTVENVFVLLTSISNYSDGYHRNINLTEGSGYYITNGTYTEIKWSKGNASSSLKFFDANGATLNVSPGSSWVCIASKTNSNTTFN